jgi:hypothetical protein
MEKILFILKERPYYTNNTNIKSYGLINSSLHLAMYLEDLGYHVNVVTVVDANGIDKVLFQYKPDMAIIEALWVPADKIKELMEIPRYKKIEFVIRVHSDIGFLSAETLSLTYINDYIGLHKKKLTIAPNHKSFTEYLANALKHELVYLPNVIHETEYERWNHHDNNHIINVGCFGALRLLKNQPYQALCAIKAADILEKILHFHITADVHKDTTLNPVVKNLEELFKNSPHKLIKHDWKENDDFIELIEKMDLGLQLSYTESFNIVTADFINCNIPIIVGEAIWWMPDILKTSTIDYEKSVKKIISVYKNKDSNFLRLLMKRSLSRYNKDAKKVWDIFLEEKLDDHYFHLPKPSPSPSHN